MNFALANTRTTASTSSLHTTTHGCVVAHLVRRIYFDQCSVETLCGGGPPIVNFTSHKHYFTTSSINTITPLTLKHHTAVHHDPKHNDTPKQFVHLQPPFKHFLQHRSPQNRKFEKSAVHPICLNQHRRGQPSLGCTNRGPPGNNLFRTQLHCHQNCSCGPLAPSSGLHPGYRGHSKQNSHVCSPSRALINTSNTNLFPVGVVRHRPSLPRSGWGGHLRHALATFVPTSPEARQGPTNRSEPAATAIARELPGLGKSPIDQRTTLNSTEMFPCPQEPEKNTLVGHPIRPCESPRTAWRCSL